MDREEIQRDFSDIIPTEIDSEIKLTKHISAADLVFIMVFLIVFSVFSKIVHPYLMIPYVIFVIAFAFILIIKSSTNPEKRLYNILLMTLLKDRAIYHPIEYKEVENE